MVVEGTPHLTMLIVATASLLLVARTVARGATSVESVARRPRAPLCGNNLGTNEGTSSSSAKPTSLAVEANKGRCVFGEETRTSSANDKGSSTHKTLEPPPRQITVLDPP